MTILTLFIYAHAVNTTLTKVPLSLIFFNVYIQVSQSFLMEKAAAEMQYTPNDTSTTKLHSSDWKFGRRSHSNLVRSKAPLLSMPVRAPARFAREKVRRIIMLSNCEL